MHQGLESEAEMSLLLLADWHSLDQSGVDCCAQPSNWSHLISIFFEFGIRGWIEYPPNLCYLFFKGSY
jgi:hypothetical protein